MTDPSPAEQLFFAALAVPRAERAALLAAADPALRARVEKLLAAAPKVGDFLDADAATAAHDGTSDYPGRDEHAGAVLAGKYKLVEEIGEGGMGSVWLAQQTEPVKRAVAVKVIKAGLDTRAVLARFEAERQALALMDHPNIARVLDAGTTAEGRPFFVMELVKGVPITDFCDKRKLTPRERLELFVPVCQAIQHAHQKGVIHRDIKPSNVLVALYDDRPVPKVIDFGVAKAAGQSLTDKTLMTGFGAVVGTPEYMSPEQASLNNLDVDTRSDVYSLGVLLYELLTGTTPVDRRSLGKAALLEVLRVVREVEAPRPSHKLSTAAALATIAANRGTEPARLSRLMKGELDWLVLKALEKDRGRRYETANALARDVRRYLADEVVEARPPSAGYRVRKWVRRNTVAVLAAGIVWALTLTQVGFSTLQWLNAETARKAAEVARVESDARRAEAEAARQAEADARQRADAARRAETMQRAVAEQALDRAKRGEADARQAAERATGVRSMLTTAALMAAYRLDAIPGFNDLPLRFPPRNPTVVQLLDAATMQHSTLGVRFEQLTFVGLLYLWLNEPERAADRLSRALAISGQPAEAVTGVRLNLARARLAAGDAPAAVGLYVEVLAVPGTWLPDGRGETPRWDVAHELAHALATANRAAEAVAVLSDPANRPPDYGLVTASWLIHRTRGKLLAGLGRWAEAGAACEDGLRMLARDTAVGTANPLGMAVRGEYRSLLGEARSRQGLPGAGWLLAVGYAELARPDPPLSAGLEMKHTVLATAAARLADYYAVVGRPAEAARWREQAKRHTPEAAPPPRPAVE